MATLRNETKGPLDLDDGRVLPAGQQADGDADHPHNAALIAAGRLAVVAAGPPPPPAPHREYVQVEVTGEPADGDGLAYDTAADVWRPITPVESASELLAYAESTVTAGNATTIDADVDGLAALTFESEGPVAIRGRCALAINNTLNSGFLMKIKEGATERARASGTAFAANNGIPLIPQRELLLAAGTHTLKATLAAITSGTASLLAAETYPISVEVRGRGTPGVRSSYGSGEYATGEKHVFISNFEYVPGSGKRAVIYLHGRGQNALEALDATYGAVPKALAKAGYPVLSIDAGGTAAWANTTAMTRLADAIGWAATGRFDTEAAPTKAPLIVGTSMGGMTALKYARTNSVAGVISLLGAIDPDYVHDNNVSGLAAEIETAYGGLAGWNAAIPTSAPIEFGDELTSVPILAVKSTSDTITPSASVDTFTAAAGADVIELGAVGHALTGLGTDDVVEWALATAAP